MGREKKVKKIRLCRVCLEELYMDAKELQEHAALCQRVKDIGLVLPTIHIGD